MLTEVSGTQCQRCGESTDMSTRIMLELRYINSSEVTLHLDAKLLHQGSPNAYTSVSWLMEHNEGDVPFTVIGSALLSEFSTLSGVHVMFSQYGFMLQVATIFDLGDVLWDIVQKVRH